MARYNSSVRILAISGCLRAASSNSVLLLAAARMASPKMQVETYKGLGELPPFNPDLDRDGDEPPPAVAALRAQISAADVIRPC